MAAVSRDHLHHVVERLPDDRLAAAADLLDALAAHDRLVHAWRDTLAPADEAEIGASLRREYATDEWISDEAMARWIDSVGTDHELSGPSGEPQ